jgi:hypothetical protein
MQLIRGQTQGASGVSTRPAVVIGPDPVGFYTAQSRMTDPGDHRVLLDALPEGVKGDVRALAKVVRGLLIHPVTAHLYGVQVPADRLAEQDTRDVASMLERIMALDSSPLDVPRPTEKRFVGVCRDFATLLCSLLRHESIPARTRTGCADYFEPGFNVDHWVCEYWQPIEVKDLGTSTGIGTGAGASTEVGARTNGRWVLVDAELDEVHIGAYGITFDPHDVPRERFLVAGEAWLRCRAGEADSDAFGVTAQMPPNSPIRGWPYLQGQVVRDFASLNKMELLCWDAWGLADALTLTTASDELTLLDYVAGLALQPDGRLGDSRCLYEEDPRLSVPPRLKTFLTAADGSRTWHEVAL